MNVWMYMLIHWIYIVHSFHKNIVWMKIICLHSTEKTYSLGKFDLSIEHESFV